ncbi:MAG: hypothetical protein AAF730_07930 [Bacteroidota bacterium]
MASTRTSMGYMALEALLVVLGVTLAWGLNEWRTHQIEERQARDTLASLTEELSANRAAVLASYTYHVALTDTLRALIGRGAPSSRQTFSEGFLARGTPLHAAWDAAEASGRLSYVADHLGEDTLLPYARVYQQQATYSEQKGAVSGLIYERLMDLGVLGMVQNYRNHTQIVASIAYLERELLTLYNATLPDSTAIPPLFSP